MENAFLSSSRVLGRTIPFLVAMAALIIFMLTRVVLTLISLQELNWGALAYVFSVGLLNDVIATAILVSPAALVAALVPTRIIRSRTFNEVSRFAFWVLVAALLFMAVAEFFFWQEFNTRFNFIAVDYLVYTQEVVRNILQSYPVKTLLVVIGFVAGLAVWLVRGPIRRMRTPSYDARTRACPVADCVGGTRAAIFLDKTLGEQLKHVCERISSQRRIHVRRSLFPQ